MSTSKRPPSATRAPQSQSRSRTPVNLNSTIAAPNRRGSASKEPGRAQSGSRTARGLNFLDVTVQSTKKQPTIKPNVTSPPSASIDYQVECDIAYSAYLCSLLKGKIVKKEIERLEQEDRDQLAMQRDILNKKKLALAEAKKQVKSVQVETETDQLLSSLEEFFQRFSSLTDSVNLENCFEEFLPVLEDCCNKVNVKNVKSITSQEDVNKLVAAIGKFADVTAKIVSSRSEVGSVSKLAQVIKKFEEVSNLAIEKQVSLNDLQSNESFKMFKEISDMYAEREKYDEKE